MHSFICSENRGLPSLGDLCREVFIYFVTLDNAFSFYIGCPDWHHEVFLLPTKDASVVLWDSLSRYDQIFLRDKYPDAGRGAICDLCVRSACPSVFFSRHSSSTSSSAPQSVDSGLQVPSGPLVVSGACTSLATESVEACVHSSSSGKLCLCSESHFSPQDK